MFQAGLDRLETFARDDPGTWSLLAGGIAGTVTLVASVVVLGLAARAGIATTVLTLAVGKLVVGSTLGAVGVGCAGWYLLVERVGRPSGHRGGAVGVASGLVAWAVVWQLALLWAGVRTTGRVGPEAIVAVETDLGVTVQVLGVGAVAAVPLVGLSVAALTALRRSAGPARDQAVRRRVGR